jgi:hypothetical protein
MNEIATLERELMELGSDQAYAIEARMDELIPLIEARIRAVCARLSFLRYGFLGAF